MLRSSLSEFQSGSFLEVALLCYCVDSSAVGSNSLYCDCRMEWFSRWIKSKFVEAGIARCVAPAPVANQLLLTARTNQFQYVIYTPEKVLSSPQDEGLERDGILDENVTEG